MTDQRAPIEREAREDSARIKLNSHFFWGEEKQWQAAIAAMLAFSDAERSGPIAEHGDDCGCMLCRSEAMLAFAAQPATVGGGNQAAADMREKIAVRLEQAAEQIFALRCASPFHSVSRDALSTYSANLSGWAREIREMALPTPATQAEPVAAQGEIRELCERLEGLMARCDPNSGDRSCGRCNGTCEVYDHAPDCANDDCALSLNIDDCVGVVSICECVSALSDAAVEALPKLIAALRTASPKVGEGEAHRERVEYEERILAAEIRAVALTRALQPFAAKADKWEASHPGRFNTASVQIQHRFGDFSNAREAVARHGVFSGDEA